MRRSPAAWWGIGAQVAGDKASALEMAANSRDLRFVKEHNPEFIDIEEKLLTDLDHMLGEIEGEITRPKKEQPDEAVLARILEGCQRYNMDAVDAAVAELKSYEYENGGELVSWIWENVQQFNIPEIIERLSKR